MKSWEAPGMNKYIWLILLLGVILFNLSSVSAFYCYQEQANQTSPNDGVCILNYSGVYSSTAGSWNDGDINTALIIDGPSTNPLYVNYSKPNQINQTIGWNISYRTSGPVSGIILNIPSSCQNTNTISLRINYSCSFGSGYQNFDCKNDTGWKTITNYACGLGWLHEEAMLWGFPDYIINSNNYNNITYSFSFEQFNINLTYDNNAYSGITSYLVYNNTNYTSNKNGLGSNTLLSNSIIIPYVSSQVNVSFYWLIGLSNSSGINWFNTSIYNQTINPISIDDCTINKNRIFNITNYDQDTLTKLSGNTFNVQVKVGDANLNNYYSYSNNFTNVDSATICIKNITSSYRMDSTIQTIKSGQYAQYYNIQNYTLSNTTINQNISIRQLNSSSGLAFKINVKDYSYTPIRGAIIEIDRQYVNQGNFLAIEIPLTDSSGSTVGHFILNNQLYNIYIKYNGQLLGSFLNQQVYCNPLISDCVIDLNLKSDFTTPSGLNGDSGIYYQNQAFNATTNTYSVDYSTVDGTPQTVILTGTLADNYQNTTVCSSTAFASSGTITCTPTVGSNLSVIFRLYVHDLPIFNDVRTTSSVPGSLLTPVKYIIAAALIPLLVLMGGSSASVALILFIIGIIFSSMLFIGNNNGIVGVIGAGSFVMFFITAAIILIIKAVGGGVKNG